MSSDAIIRIEGLGKRYSLRHLRDQRYITLRDVLVEKATGLFRRDGKSRGQRSEIRDQNLGNPSGAPISQLPASISSTEEFWALRDINFEVKQGEVVGIIGRNGAGKSTLLKILSRITEPTEGKVHIKGRVASLLEVGTGFHPELTGRENIFLNGAILGMSRAEIRKKFDEIVAFAETEKFLDTPVKRYSSGMYVRLAFAVAAHLEPEILVVDEVLAVGDAEFQKKCLGKMKDVSRREGRTVLFVSHNMASILTLCQEGVILRSGRLALKADVASVVKEYSGGLGATTDVSYAYAGDKPSITRIRMDESRLQGGDLVVHIHFAAPANLRSPIGGIVLTSESGTPIYGSNPRFHNKDFSADATGSAGTLRVEVRDLPIRNGTYRLSAWLGDWHQDYDEKLDAVTLEWTAAENYPLQPNIHATGSLQWLGRWSVQIDDKLYA